MSKNKEERERDIFDYLFERSDEMIAFGGCPM